MLSESGGRTRVDLVKLSQEIKMIGNDIKKKRGSASFIDLQTGEWRPEIVAMVESAPQFERMQFESKYRDVLSAAKSATSSIGKSTDSLVPFVERGCITDIERLLKMRGSIALIFSTNPTLLSTVQAELDAECGKQK
jgi:hypothetical protein